MHTYLQIFSRFLIILFNCVSVWLSDFNWKTCVFGLPDLSLELGVDIFLSAPCFFISLIRECSSRHYIWNAYTSHKCVSNSKHVKAVHREPLLIYFLIRKIVYIWYTCLLSEVVLAVLIIKQLVVLAVVSARCKIYKHTSWLLSSSVFRVASTSSKATTIPQCSEMTYALAVRSIHHCVISQFTVGKLMFFN